MSATVSRRAFLRGRFEPEPQAGARIAVLGDGCLATAGVACGICADPCEARALRLKPRVGGRALPVIDAAACTGCGACIPICPASSLRLVAAPSVPEAASCA